MKRVIALLLALILVVCLSATAFAASNQGGTPSTDPKSPKTGSVAVIALAVVACGAGAAYAVSRNKSK